MKQQWRNASNGPDWTDVLLTMKAIEVTHAASCYIGLTPSGGGNDGVWCVSAMAVLPVLLDKLEAAACVVQRDWPNADHGTLAACVYAMLIQLDWAIGSECYVQNQF